MTQEPRFIVAEVSKNWFNGREVKPSGLLAQQFETVIAHNLARGYRLHSFQLHRLMTGPTDMNETIIAVFERDDTPPVVHRVFPSANQQ